MRFGFYTAVEVGAKKKFLVRGASRHRIVYNRTSEYTTEIP